LGYNGWH